MKLTGLKNSRMYNIRLADYAIDWNPPKEVSRPQGLVKQFLCPFWRTHVVAEELKIPASRCRIDLINFTRRIVIEVSPASSHSFNKFFHKNRINFSRAVQRDLDKQSWAERNGFQYIELGSDDIGNLSVKLFEDMGIDL